MDVETQQRFITLNCPECSHEQTEPAIVISTNCRSCGQYFSVHGEKSVVRRQYTARVASSERPPLEYPAVAPKPTQVGERKPTEVGFLRRFFTRQGEKRPIDCYHCGWDFQVVAEAQSTQCPKCGGYISLRDYEISDSYQQRIQTRGNVTILKAGFFSGEKLDCHDLMVYGKLSGSVSCSGTLAIRAHGRFPSDIKCKELRVERGSKVELQGEVLAESVSINGKVKANINCLGAIVLEKKALLQGVARATSVVTKSGAKHCGTLEVPELDSEAGM